MRGVTEKRGLQREVGRGGCPWGKGRLEVRFRTVFKAIQVDDICTRGSAVGWTCVLFPGTVWLGPVRALPTGDPVWMEITSSLGAQCRIPRGMTDGAGGMEGHPCWVMTQLGGVCTAALQMTASLAAQHSGSAGWGAPVQADVIRAQRDPRVPTRRGANPS